MTTKKCNTKLMAVEAVVGDRDLMKSLLEEALQDVLEREMTEFLGAAPGERTEARGGYQAGYYGRNLVTRIGKLELELRVPRDRNGEFSTALFERYARSEKALVACTSGASRRARSRPSLKNCVATASQPARSAAPTRG